MALLWLEGFEALGTTLDVAFGTSGALLQRKYEVVSSPNNWLRKAGRIGGICARGDNDACDMTTPTLGNNQTIVVGWAYRINTANIAHKIIEFLEPGDLVGLNVRLKVDGEYEVYLNNTLLATTVGASIGLDTWAYFEFKGKVDNAAGTYELRINSVVEAIGAGADTQNGSSAYANKIRFTPSGSGSIGFFDDMYILNDAGALNNTFLNNQRIEALYPNTEGDSNTWTGSSGTDNSLLVDEVEANDDSDYVQASSAGSLDLYNYQAIPSITSIKGMHINTDVRETDATTFSLITPIKSNGFTSEDAPQVIGSASYVNRKRISESDPSTSVAWTPTGLNAAQIGVKVP